MKSEINTYSYQDKKLNETLILDKHNTTLKQKK